MAGAAVGIVGVISADRPQLLARALADARAHVDRCGRTPEFVVVDRSSRGSGQTTALPGAETFVPQLASSGFDAELLSWALLSGSPGANRNLLCLLTAGDRLLMVDDDIRWTTWRQPGHDGRIIFGNHIDPRETEFFRTRAEAIAAASLVDADLLAEHGRLLGESATGLLAHDPDLGAACTHLREGLESERPMTVRVTLGGLAGDAGTYCPYQWLFAQGVSRAGLLSSEERFTRALSSREMHRLAPRPVVMHDAYCMAGCMGLDNQSPVPPFMPIGRNEDGVFGTMLAAAVPGCLFAHVPLGVVHDSIRPPAHGAGSIVSASQTRLADLVTAAVRWSSVAAVAELSASEFRERVIALIASSRRFQLEYLQADADDTGLPLYWRRAAGTYRSQLLSSMTRPDFYRPMEFAGMGTLDDGFQATQLFFRQFSRLLDIWPGVWSRARELRWENREARPSIGA